MTIPPWTPEIRDGRIYGRGACDIKGGMACTLAAVSRLAEQRPAEMPTIIMACSVDENMASAVRRRWGNGGPAENPVGPPRTGCSHSGGTDGPQRGRGPQGSRAVDGTHARHARAARVRPELGVSAINGMAKILNVLEEYARDVAPGRGDHPLVGRPSLSVGVIGGGLSVNTVPDHCPIQIDRRVLPGEDNVAAQQHVIDFVRERVPNGLELEHEPTCISPRPVFPTHGIPRCPARLSAPAGGMADQANAWAFRMAPMLPRSIAFTHRPWCLAPARLPKLTPAMNGLRSSNSKKRRTS